MDHICKFLIDGDPLFDCPTVLERSRTTDEEDEFFENLTYSTDYLRNERYERWLKLKSLGRWAGDLIRHLPFGIGDSLLELGRRRWHSLLKWVESGEPVFPQRH